MQTADCCAAAMVGSRTSAIHWLLGRPWQQAVVRSQTSVGSFKTRSIEGGASRHYRHCRYHVCPTPCALARTQRTVQCPPLSPFGLPHLQEHVFRNTTVPHHLLNLDGYISTGHFNTFLRGNFFDSFAGESN